MADAYRDLNRDGVPDEIEEQARARYGNDWRSNPEAVQWAQSTYQAGAGTQQGYHQTGEFEGNYYDAPTYNGQLSPWEDPGYTDDPALKDEWLRQQYLTQLEQGMPGLDQLRYQSTDYDPALIGRSAYEDLQASGAGTPQATAQLQALERMRGAEGLQLGGAAQARGTYGLDQEASGRRQAASGAGGGAGYLSGLQRASEGRLEGVDALQGAGRELAAEQATAQRLALGAAGSQLRDQSFGEAYARGEGIDQDRYRDLAAINDARGRNAAERFESQSFNATAPSRYTAQVTALDSLARGQYDRVNALQQQEAQRARDTQQQDLAALTQVGTGIGYAAYDRASQDDDEDERPRRPFANYHTSGTY